MSQFAFPPLGLVIPPSPSGSTPNLAAVLGVGNDAGGLGILDLGDVQLGGNLEMSNTGAYIGWDDAQITRGGSGTINLPSAISASGDDLKLVSNEPSTPGSTCSLTFFVTANDTCTLKCDGNYLSFYRPFTPAAFQIAYNNYYEPNDPNISNLPLEFPAGSSGGTPDSGAARIYSKLDGSSSAQMFAMGEDGNEMQLTGTLGSATGVTNISGALGILAQVNGTNAQEFRVYNTTDGVGNNEWGSMSWQESTNQLYIGSFSTGTGTRRPVIFSSPSFQFASDSLVGFFGAIPVAQQIPAGGATIASLGSGTPVLNDTTFYGYDTDYGYSVADIICALQNFGLLAY